MPDALIFASSCLTGRVVVGRWTGAVLTAAGQEPPPRAKMASVARPGRDSISRRESS
jgi:hypothetical protein